MNASSDRYRSGWDRVFGSRWPVLRGLNEDVMSYFQRLVSRGCDDAGNPPPAIAMPESDWLKLRERAHELERQLSAPPPLEPDSREPFTLYGVRVEPTR